MQTLEVHWTKTAVERNETTLRTVRVLLAAAIARATRAGVDRHSLRQLFCELIACKEETNA